MACAKFITMGSNDKKEVVRITHVIEGAKNYSRSLSDLRPRHSDRVSIFLFLRYWFIHLHFLKLPTFHPFL